MATTAQTLAALPAELLEAVGWHVETAQLEETRRAVVARLEAGDTAYVEAFGTWRLGVVVKKGRTRACVAYTTPSSRGRIYLATTDQVRVAYFHKAAEVPVPVVDDTNPHVMVQGERDDRVPMLGAIATECARRGWDVRICSSAQSTIAGPRNRPIQGAQIRTSVQDITAAIRQAHAQMSERYDRIQRGPVGHDDLRPVVLVVDELSDFRRQLDAWSAPGADAQRGTSTSDKVFDLVTEIATKGRAAGMHLVLGAASPDTDRLPVALLANVIPVDSRDPVQAAQTRA